MTVDEQHPILKIQQNKFTSDEEQKLADIGTIWGTAMPMMIRYERNILSQPERLPGLKSSFISTFSLIQLSNLIWED